MPRDRICDRQRTQVPGADIDHPERNFKILVDTFLDFTHPLMHFLRAIGVGEGEHFDFGKLMNPYKPSIHVPQHLLRFGNNGTVLRKAGELVRVDDLVRQQPPRVISAVAIRDRSLFSTE